jgi:hypothetical protein
MDIKSTAHHISPANSNHQAGIPSQNKFAEKESSAIAALKEKKAESIKTENVNSDNKPVEKPTDTEQADTSYQQIISQLKSRDREVRAHETAHLAAAGQHAAGGISYTYQTGPDDNKYAVGGEVSIDTSPVRNDPEATLIKAQQVQRAALAPAEPSSQDRAVANQAASMAMQARKDIAQQANTERAEKSENNLSKTSSETSVQTQETRSSHAQENAQTKNDDENSLTQSQKQFQIRNMLTA